MPELPDITLYVEALTARLAGAALERTELRHPFVLRTFAPPLTWLQGARVRTVRRVGKRVAIGFHERGWLVLHLMIAGRLHWSAPGARRVARSALAHFVFSTGTLTLTEAGSRRRAAVYVLDGDEALARIDPGGLETLEAPLDEFRARLTAGNHTLKRALTDPRLMSGIGNAYSDEILHRAQLSPLALTSSLDEASIGRLYAATRAVLGEWTRRLRAESAGAFPEGVTAFRPQMAVHGRFGQPCPVCGTAVQRIRYAENETHYCPRCQTGGRVLADRSLSRLLKADWPRTVEELERM